MKKSLIALLASTIISVSAFAAEEAPKADKCCGEKTGECAKGDKPKGKCEGGEKKSCDQEKGCPEQKK